MRDFFDRKLFDPVSNEDDKATLAILRAYGGRRFRSKAKSTAFKWAFKSKVKKPSVFLDLGCGNSADTYVARKRGLDAYGLDLFPPDVENFGNFKQADVVENIPWPDGSVSIIVCQAMLDLIEPAAREQFYREVNRVLKPGGVFACYIQWLETGWGIDVDEERARAKRIWKQIDTPGNGFLIQKGGK